MKSGFGGFNSLSSTSDGKRTTIDSYGGAIDRAIKTILGDEDAIIYTTAVPSTIYLDNIGVHRWDPLNCSQPNLFLTQSTNTSKPSLSTTYSLGKYPSIYTAGLTQWMRTPVNTYSSIYTAKRNTFAYYGWTAYPVITSSETTVIRCFYITGSVSWGPTAFTSYTNNQTRFGYTPNIYVTGTLNRFIRLNYTASNAPVIFGQTGSNDFRLTEEIYDSTNRVVTASYYDENKNLIKPTDPALGPAGNQWLASFNDYSFTFSQVSVSASVTGWDNLFPNKSFAPHTLGIGVPSNVDGKVVYHTVIQSLVNNLYSPTAVQNLKNLLDKVYGV